MAIETTRSPRTIGQTPITIPPRHLFRLPPLIPLELAVITAVGVFLGIYVVLIAYLPAKLAPTAFLALLASLSVLIVGNLRRVLLAIAIFGIPISLDMHFGYRLELEAWGAFPGLDISVVTMALAGLYALWLAELLSKHRSAAPPMWRSSWPLALYLAFSALSMFAARDVILSSYAFVLLLQALLLFIYIVSTVRTREDILFVISMLILSLVVESLIIVTLRVIGHSITVGSVLARVDIDTTGAVRIGGTVGSPNDAAMYLDMMLPIALTLLMAPVGRWHKLLALMGFGLGSIALILTFSRGGWAGFVVAVFLVFLVAWHRGWFSPAIPVASAVVAISAFLLFQPAISARIFADDQGSAYSRIVLMQIAFRVIAENPVLGVGLNNFAVVLKDFVTPQFSGDWIYTVHNKYLLVWAETGIGGFIAFTTFLLATLHQGWKSLASRNRFFAPMSLGVTTGVFALMINMLVQVVNSQPHSLMLGLVAATIYAVGRSVNEEERKMEGGHTTDRSNSNARRDSVSRSSPALHHKKVR